MHIERFIESADNHCYLISCYLVGIVVVFTTDLTSYYLIEQRLSHRSHYFNGFLETGEINVDRSSAVAFIGTLGCAA